MAGPGGSRPATTADELALEIGVGLDRGVVFGFNDSFSSSPMDLALEIGIGFCDSCSFSSSEALSSLHKEFSSASDEEATCGCCLIRCHGWEWYAFRIFF